MSMEQNDRVRAVKLTTVDLYLTLIRNKLDGDKVVRRQTSRAALVTILTDLSTRKITRDELSKVVSLGTESDPRLVAVAKLGEIIISIIRETNGDDVRGKVLEQFKLIVTTARLDLEKRNVKDPDEYVAQLVKIYQLFLNYYTALCPESTNTAES